MGGNGVRHAVTGNKVDMTAERGGARGKGHPQSARARRWAWLPVLVVGVVLYIAVRQALMITGNPILVPSLLVLGLLVIPVSFVVYVDGRNPVYDVPLSVLLSCALLGGVWGATSASVLEFDAVRRLGELPAVFVAVIEEAAKLLVPIAVLILTRYRARAADGLLVGIAVGFGFAVLETLGYAFVILLATGGDLADVEGLVLVRAALSPAGHAAWTGVAAAALWWAHSQRWRPRGLAAVVGAFALAVLFHTLWTTTAWYTYLIIGTLSLTLLLTQTHRTILNFRSAPLEVSGAGRGHGVSGG